MDRQCAICLEDLDCVAQDPSVKEDTDISETVFRLQCGHAFHMNCIVRQLRKVNQCPTCRGSSVPSLPTQFVGNLGGIQLTIPLDFPENEIEEGELVSIRSAPFWSTLETLSGLRNTDLHIKRKRHELNQELKSYFALERDLQQKRRKVLCNALETFRSEEFPKQNKKVRSLRRKLKAVKQAEHAALLRHLGSDRFQELHNVLFDMDSMQDIRSYQRRRTAFQMEPSRPSFWNH